MRVTACRLVLVVLCMFAYSLISTPIQAAPPLDTPESYVVQSGDTLSAIAIRYHTTVAVLKQVNGLKSDLLQVGQKLRLPTTDNNSAAPAPSTSYVVQSGDTLYRIALRFGTTPRAIEDYNGIPNPNLISVGQALAIPGNSSLVKPGLVVDPPVARQGGTLLIQVARPDLASVSGTFGGDRIPFTRGAGYFYGLVGISRCAKLGNAVIRLTETDVNGKASTESETTTIGATAFLVQKLTLTPGVAALLDPTLVKKEAEQLAALVSPFTPGRLWSGTFRQPLTGTITSYFGHRRSYNGGPVGACGHEGIDFGVPTGTAIHSDGRGRVVFAGLTKVRGNMVVVDHGIGVYSAYYHQSEIDVQAGQMVNAGDLIGKVGSTGLSTGSHLHWSMFVNGEYVDPAEWTRRVFP